MSNKIIVFPKEKKQPSIKVSKIPATIRTLALALKVKLNISSDSSLVYVMGKGEASSNQNAIEIWLLENYEEYSLKSMITPLEYLANELTHFLNEKISSMEGY